MFIAKISTVAMSCVHEALTSMAGSTQSDGFLTDKLLNSNQWIDQRFIHLTTDAVVFKNLIRRMIFRDRPNSFFCAGFSAIAAYGTGLHANKVATRKNSHAVDILAKNTLFYS